MSISNPYPVHPVNPVFIPSPELKLTNVARASEELRLDLGTIKDLGRRLPESAAELDALLPAILDRAFKGEL